MLFLVWIFLLGAVQYLLYNGASAKGNYGHLTASFFFIKINVIDHCKTDQDFVNSVFKISVFETKRPHKLGG